MNTPKSQPSKCSVTPSDYGTAERHAQEGGLRIEVAEKTKKGHVVARRARSEYPSSLHWYFKKGAISAAMLEAGTIFAHHFYRAMISGQPQSCLRDPIKVDRSRGMGEGGSEYAEDARRKVHKCYDLLTPLEADVISSVAGMDERAAGDKRALALKTGLRALTVMFRIPVDR